MGLEVKVFQYVLREPFGNSARRFVTDVPLEINTQLQKV